MTKPMTHLDAFCSDDAKRGRVWTCKLGGRYRRASAEDQLGGVFGELDDIEAFAGNKWTRWRPYTGQLLVTVTWADEPKTLTPQEGEL